MPTFATPGVITPGQFGPTRVVVVPARYACTVAMSRTGMPSVMHTTSPTPASAASRIASAANRGGTKIIDVFAPVAAHGVGDGVEHGDALDVLPALAGRDAGDDVGPVRAVPERVEGAFAAR